MRVLLVRRFAQGGMAKLADLLAEELPRQGVEAQLVDAKEWMPAETGFWVDRKVSKRLKEIAEPEDVLHAMGYRCAWAFASAFSVRRRWLYTAYDPPRTTHSVFIDKLNHARMGVCSSPSVRKTLLDANALNLTTVVPGVRLPGEKLDFPTDPSVLFAVEGGRDSGEDAIAPCLSDIWRTVPDAVVRIWSDEKDVTKEDYGVRSDGRDLILEPPGRALAEALAETQLVVVPATRSGFSPAAAVAMAHGRPVLMRATGGLPDMGVAGQSAAFFEQDEQLGERIADLLQTPLRLRSMADAAALRAKLRFDPQKCVEQYLGVYRDL
jgi:hypothetical protein